MSVIEFQTNDASRNQRLLVDHDANEDEKVSSIELFSENLVAKKFSTFSETDKTDPSDNSHSLAMNGSSSSSLGTNFLGNGYETDLESSNEKTVCLLDQQQVFPSNEDVIDASQHIHEDLVLSSKTVPHPIVHNVKEPDKILFNAQFTDSMKNESLSSLLISASHDIEFNTQHDESLEQQDASVINVNSNLKILEPDSVVEENNEAVDRENMAVDVEQCETAMNLQKDGHGEVPEDVNLLVGDALQDMNPSSTEAVYMDSSVQGDQLEVEREGHQMDYRVGTEINFDSIQDDSRTGFENDNPMTYIQSSTSSEVQNAEFGDASADENTFCELNFQDDMIMVQEYLQEEEIIEEFGLPPEVSENDKNSSHEESDDCDDEKYPLSYELQQGHRILHEIMTDGNKSVNWPFMRAVDAAQDGCQDYYDKIRRPIWLSKMKEKFDRREYDSITQFVADMRLMLENCYRYNGPDHPISRKGQKLEVMLEQKLALLSRELRDKTSLAATSGKSVEVATSGSRRQKIVVPPDSTALLNKLRWEAQKKERDIRRQQQFEKKMAYERFLESLQSWEDKLLESPLYEQMKAMWELPQIGQFLFLCSVPLNVSVTQYEVERCFLLARESSAMHRIMTALLSSQHQRNKFQGKSVMPYRVWEEKLRVLLRSWYKMLTDFNMDIKQTSQKLGLEEKFFDVVGHSNPLEKRKYHELSYYQKVWIAKSLCDYCLESQKLMIDAIEIQQPLDQRELVLGTDSLGNSYIHFPLFCGDDLRIYRQSALPVIEMETSKEANLNRKRRRSRRNRSRHQVLITDKAIESSAPRLRDSRLRQNPRQVQNYQVKEDESESTGDSGGTTDDEDTGDDSKEEDKPSGKVEAIVLKETEENKTSGEGETTSDEVEMSEEEKEREVPVKVGSRKMETRPRRGAKEKKKEDLPEEPDWQSSLVPRRSLRKVIEESKKDAEAVQTPKQKVCARASQSGNKHGATEAEEIKSSKRSSSVKSKEKPPEEKKPAEEKKVDRSCSSGRRKILSRGRRWTRKNKTPSRGKTNKDCEIPESGRSLDRISRNLMKELDYDNEDTDIDEIHPPRFADSRSGSPASKIFEKEKEDAAEKSSTKCTPMDTDDQSSNDNLESPTFKADGTKLTDVMDNCADIFENITNEKIDEVKECLAGKSLPLPSPGKNEKDMEFNKKILESENFEIEKDTLEEGSTVVMTEEMIPNDLQNVPNSNSIQEGKESEDGNVCRRNDEGMDEKVEDRERTDEKMIKNKADKDLKLDRKMENKDASSEVKKDESEKESSVELDSGAKTGPSDVESDPTKVKITDEQDLVKCEVKTEDEVATIEAESTNESGKILENEKVEENTCETEEELPPPLPDLESFELVADSIESLRVLAAKFADTDEIDAESSGNNALQNKPSSRKSCEVELHRRLTCLLKELEPYEQRLIQVNKKKKILMRKEHENYREQPEQVEEWESNDAASSASHTSVNARVDEESLDAHESSVTPVESRTMIDDKSGKRAWLDAHQPNDLTPKRSLRQKPDSAVAMSGIVTRKRRHPPVGGSVDGLPVRKRGRGRVETVVSTPSVDDRRTPSVANSISPQFPHDPRMRPSTSSVARLASSLSHVLQYNSRQPAPAAIGSFSSNNLRMPPRMQQQYARVETSGSTSAILSRLLPQASRPAGPRTFLKIQPTSGGGTQYLAIDDLNLLPPSVIQALASSFPNITVLPSHANAPSNAIGHVLSSSNAHLLSPSVHTTTVVEGTSRTLMAGSSSNLPYSVPSSVPLARSSFSAVMSQLQSTPCFMFPSPSSTQLPAPIIGSCPISMAMLGAQKQAFRSVAPTSVGHPLMTFSIPGPALYNDRINLASRIPFPTSQPLLPTDLPKQKYTGNLTVKELLGNKSYGIPTCNISEPNVLGPTISGPTISGPTISGPTISGPNIGFQLPSSSFIKDMLTGADQPNGRGNGEVQQSAGSTASANNVQTCKSMMDIIRMSAAARSALPGNYQLQLMLSTGSVVANRSEPVPSTIPSSVQPVSNTSNLQSSSAFQFAAQNPMLTRVNVAQGLSRGVAMPMMQYATVLPSNNGLQQVALLTGEQLTALIKKNPNLDLGRNVSSLAASTRLQSPSTVQMGPPVADTKTTATTLPVSSIAQLVTSNASAGGIHLPPCLDGATMVGLPNSMLRTVSPIQLIQNRLNNLQGLTNVSLALAQAGGARLALAQAGGGGLTLAQAGGGGLTLAQAGGGRLALAQAGGARLALAQAGGGGLALSGSTVRSAIGAMTGGESPLKGVNIDLASTSTSIGKLAVSGATFGARLSMPGAATGEVPTAENQIVGKATVGGGVAGLQKAIVGGSTLVGGATGVVQILQNIVYLKPPDGKAIQLGCIKPPSIQSSSVPAISLATISPQKIISTLQPGKGNCATPSSLQFVMSQNLSTPISNISVTRPAALASTGSVQVGIPPQQQAAVPSGYTDQKAMYHFVVPPNQHPGSNRFVLSTSSQGSIFRYVDANQIPRFGILNSDGTTAPLSVAMPSSAGQQLTIASSPGVGRESMVQMSQLSSQQSPLINLSPIGRSNNIGQIMLIPNQLSGQRPNVAAMQMAAQTTSSGYRPLVPSTMVQTTQSNLSTICMYNVQHSPIDPVGSAAYRLPSGKPVENIRNPIRLIMPLVGSQTAWENNPSLVQTAAHQTKSVRIIKSNSHVIRTPVSIAPCTTTVDHCNPESYCTVAGQTNGSTLFLVNSHSSTPAAGESTTVSHNSAQEQSQLDWLLRAAQVIDGMSTAPEYSANEDERTEQTIATSEFS